MSAKTIAAYQERYGKPLTFAEQLRMQAGNLRRQGAGMLASANALDELADLSDEKPARRCDCGAAMMFETSTTTYAAVHVACWCPRCKTRSERDGAAGFVYGRGSSEAEAFADWRSAIDRQ